MKFLSFDLSGKAPGTYSLNGLPVTFIHANGQKSRPLGDPKHIVMHWTAGTYTQVWDDYHFNVVFDSSKNLAYVVRTLKPTQLGQHLWGRNTGAYAVTFSAMANATSQNYGRYPVTAAQIEAASHLIAELMAWKQLNPHENIQVPDKYVSRGVLLSSGRTNTVSTISDHATFANLDDYGSERWDIAKYMPQVSRQVQHLYDDLKDGSKEFYFKELIR